MSSTPIFEKFKILKSKMEEQGWIIEAFPFNYKNESYIVLVKLYQENEIKPKFSLLKTEIINSNNVKNNITIPINSNGFLIDAKRLRTFFKIKFSKNLGDILQQFSQNFSRFIPTNISQNKPESLISIMISSLSINDSEDPNKKYCYTIKRNPNNNRRTPFNDNKTKLLRPNLYSKFKNEPNISFCYSHDKKDERSDEEILLSFSKRYN